MNAYPMTNRTLAHPMVSNDGSQQHVINYSNLEGFQMETVQRVNELQNKCLDLEYNLNSVKDLVAWIGIHRPDAINDYHTTNKVSQRLSESNNGEVMTEAR